MPELPEVQTTVDGINSYIVGKTITDVWTDLAVASPSPIHTMTTKSRAFFETFKKNTIGAKVTGATRRAKNIFIHLSNGNSIKIHMKMTGHLLYGRYTFSTSDKIWQPSTQETNDALRDPFNRYLHTVFILDNVRQLALSDVRKFASVTLVKTSSLPAFFATLGPEPLEKTFTATICKNQLLKRPNSAIKKVLLDQAIIAGIGNIYSDEALWYAGIHPFRIVSAITETEMKLLYKGIITALKRGLRYGGDSTSDYRDIEGKRGLFQNNHQAYRRTGLPCRKPGCTGTIARIAFSGRGAHFCDTHQK